MQISTRQHAPICLRSSYKNKWIAVKYAGEIKKKTPIDLLVH